jgi:hypothetical protein
VQSQENDMTELVMTTEAEVEDFSDELSDEALDRAEGGYPIHGLSCGGACVCVRHLPPVADR